MRRYFSAIIMTDHNPSYKPADELTPYLVVVDTVDGEFVVNKKLISRPSLDAEYALATKECAKLAIDFDEETLKDGALLTSALEAVEWVSNHWRAGIR